MWPAVDAAAHRLRLQYIVLILYFNFCLGFNEEHTQKRNCRTKKTFVFDGMLSVLCRRQRNGNINRCR